MAHYWYKHIFGEVKRLCPLMHISEEEYTAILSREAKRTDGSLKALTLKEYLAIKDKLEADARALGKALPPPEEDIDKISATKDASLKAGKKQWRGDKMINKIKAMCYKDPAYQGLDKPEVWRRIDAFLTARGKFKKALNHHTYAELVQLIPQVEGVLRNNLKQYNK